MVITNQTNQDYWFGPLHLAAGVNQTLTVDDTTATSLYLTDDSVADAINYLYAQSPAKITVSGAAMPFPRPTGTPTVLHGDGSPEGLVYASEGSIYLRRDLAKVYQKTTMVHINIGWALVSEFDESALKATTLYETTMRQIVADDLTALATGTLVMCGIDLPGGMLINNITFVSGATAAGTPLNQWFALYDGSTLKKLAVTADDTTTAWAANAAKTLAISGGYRTQGRACSISAAWSRRPRCRPFRASRCVPVSRASRRNCAGHRRVASRPRPRLLIRRRHSRPSTASRTPTSPRCRHARNQHHQPGLLVWPAAPCIRQRFVY